MGILSGANLSQTYTTLDEGNTPGLGDLFYGTGSKVYKFVLYEAATAATAGVSGEMTGYYLLDGHKDNVVTSDFSDTLSIGAGVLQAAAADGEYCWVQIKGPVTLTIAATAGADGDAMTIDGAGDGTLDVSLIADTGIYQHICAYAGDISDNEYVLDCPF
jgi:hypothetical protein